MNRVLEFSRTVGLCNYSTSPGQGALASLASRLDSESGEENLMSPIGRSSANGRQYLKPYIDYAARGSGAYTFEVTLPH